MLAAVVWSRHNIVFDSQLLHPQLSHLAGPPSKPNLGSSTRLLGAVYLNAK